MKILMVHELLGAQGGAEATLRRLCVGLSNQGHRLRFLYQSKSEQGVDEAQECYEKVFSFESCLEQGLDHCLAWE
ncbi:MAG: hypothetical protein MK135_07470, partial [Polyangiaceae bacterium]|nr:hypothetical protein [Polyangiaceae bacterium]